MQFITPVKHGSYGFRCYRDAPTPRGGMASDNVKIVRVQAGGRDVEQLDGVRRIDGNDRVVAGGRRGAEDRGGIGEQAVMEFDHVVAAGAGDEIRDDVLCRSRRRQQ